MDRAGADNDEESLPVLPMQNAANSVSGFNDQRGSLIGNRELGLDRPRRGQRLDFNNVLVIEWSLHGPAFSPGNRLQYLDGGERVRKSIKYSGYYRKYPLEEAPDGWRCSDGCLNSIV